MILRGVKRSLLSKILPHNLLIFTRSVFKDINRFYCRFAQNLTLNVENWSIDPIDSFRIIEYIAEEDLNGKCAMIPRKEETLN